MAEKLYVKVNGTRIYGYTESLAKRPDAVVMTQGEVDAWLGKKPTTKAPAKKRKAPRKRVQPQTVVSDTAVDPETLLEALHSGSDLSGRDDEGSSNPSG